MYLPLEIINIIYEYSNIWRVPYEVNLYFVIRKKYLHDKQIFESQYTNPVSRFFEIRIFNQMNDHYKIFKCYCKHNWTCLGHKLLNKLNLSPDMIK